MDITFVKWKWLITKSIDDDVITGWFECWIDLYEKLHKALNKPLKLNIELDWLITELDCNICTDTRNYLSFVEDHWLVKLDIIIFNIWLIWLILKWNLKLKID